MTAVDPERGPAAFRRPDEILAALALLAGIDLGVLTKAGKIVRPKEKVNQSLVTVSPPKALPLLLAAEAKA